MLETTDKRSTPRDVNKPLSEYDRIRELASTNNMVIEDDRPDYSPTGTFRIEARGRTFCVDIVFDDCPSNPREEFDHLGTLVLHRRLISDSKVSDAISLAASESYHALVKAIHAEYGHDAIIIPVWRYEHGGVIYRAADSNPFTCPWDSGCAGAIFVSREDARANFKTRRLTDKLTEQTRDILIGEVEEFGAWAGGDVYGWRLRDHGEELDSCYGFYGGDRIPDMLEDAVSCIAAHLSNREVQR